MVSNAEDPTDTTASASDSKSPNAAPPKPRVPSRRRGAAKKVASSKRRATSPKNTKGAKPAERTSKSSKGGKIVELLKRPGGATLKELIKATGWQAHSVRGFLSGTVRKKMGLGVTSSKTDSADRRYSVEG